MSTLAELGVSFQQATHESSKARIGLYGPPGGGKTLTALELAAKLADGIENVAVIDTEHGSARKYVPLVGRFQVIELPSFSPDWYIEAVQMALRAGHPAIVVDSLSHAWEGDNGLLAQQSRFTEAARGNSQEGWNKVKPIEQRLWNGILTADAHMVVTMRSRNEWREWEENGKKKREIVGLEPIQRKGTEYEFDIVALMRPYDGADKPETGTSVELVVEKSRYPEHVPGGSRQVFLKQGDGDGFYSAVAAALSAGEPVAPATEAEVSTLVALLEAEGKEERRIKDVFEAEKSRNQGTLPQAFVQKAIEQALRRAETKQREGGDDGQSGEQQATGGDGAASADGGEGGGGQESGEGGGAGGE